MFPEYDPRHIQAIMQATGGANVIVTKMRFKGGEHWQAICMKGQQTWSAQGDTGDQALLRLLELIGGELGSPPPPPSHPPYLLARFATRFDIVYTRRAQCYRCHRRMPALRDDEGSVHCARCGGVVHETP